MEEKNTNVSQTEENPSLHPYAELRKAGTKPRRALSFYFCRKGRERGEIAMYRALYRKWRPQRFEMPLIYVVFAILRF